MPNPTERNFALERIIDRLELGILSCTNKGCDHESPKLEMVAHAAECKYRSGQEKSKEAKKSNEAKKAKKEELGPPGLSIILLIMAGLSIIFLIMAASIALVAIAVLMTMSKEDEMFKMKEWIVIIGSCSCSFFFLAAIILDNFNPLINRNTTVD